jgi:hypothetical protein
MTQPEPEPATLRPWHRALAYAVTGRRLDGLGEQASPEVSVLRAELDRQLGPGVLAARARERLAAGQRWPDAVPGDLMTGLGHAQFAAALTELRRLLDVDRPVVPRASSEDGSTRSADLRRLLDEVPPHHGS